MKQIKIKILLLSTVLVVFNSCKNEPEQRQKDNIISVKTTFAKTGIFPYIIHSSGKLSSKSELKLSFKTGGIINSIHTEEGLEVQKGATLAELKFDEIYAQVKKARLGYDKAKRDFERTESLYHDSVATLEQFQDIQTALNVAESNVKIAEFNLEHSKILAPENGKILKKLAEENEVIGAGYPVFLFGTSTSDWILKMNIVDKDLVNLNYQDSAWMYFDAFPGKKYLGFVSEIGSMADPYTGTYEVEIRITNPDEKFATGFIASVDIISKKTQKYILVPVNALLEGNENTGYIYLLENNSPVKTKISIESFDNNYLYVSKGIKENDQIITEGAKYITKSSQIRIINK